MHQYTGHTFAICAYGESPYLEKCILSLKDQRIGSRIIMATATPNHHIRQLADKYEIPLFINSEGGSIAKDWMYALNAAETDLVTLAHQDDIYEPEYLAGILRAVKRASKPIIIFTDYGELREEKRVTANRLLKVKRIMLFPLRFKFMQASKWVRRRILSLGSPISCPTVTYVKKRMPSDLFNDRFSCDLDWQAWESLSKLKGSFVYAPEILMYHRIHCDSTTTKIIQESGRAEEDLRMLCEFWPKPIAAFINRFYNKATRSNEI